MRRSLFLMSVAVVLFGPSAVCADEKAADYLKEDGKLKERLEVVELQGGIVGFTGHYYAVEPDGSWSTGAVIPGKGTKGEATATGQLTETQLAELATELAKHNLAGLSSHGEPVVNPKVIRIHFGEKVSELQPNRGKSSAEDQAIRARFDGIAQAVKLVCREPKP